MHFLGRQHGLLGTDTASRIRCDVTVEVWRDYNARVERMFSDDSTSEATRAAFVENELPERLAALESFYSQNASRTNHWVGD